MTSVNRIYYKSTRFSYFIKCVYPLAGLTGAEFVNGVMKKTNFLVRGRSKRIPPIVQWLSYSTKLSLEDGFTVLPYVDPHANATSSVARGSPPPPPVIRWQG